VILAATAISHRRNDFTCAQVLTVEIASASCLQEKGAVENQAKSLSRWLQREDLAFFLFLFLFILLLDPSRSHLHPPHRSHHGRGVSGQAAQATERSGSGAGATADRSDQTGSEALLR